MSLLRAVSEVRENRATAAARRRAAKLPTYDLLEWGDAAISGIGRALMDFRRGVTVDAGTSPLDEAIMGVDSLRIMLEELAARRDAGNL